MKKIILLILVTLVSTGLHSQDLNYNDTLVDGIDSSWSNDNLQIDGDTSQVAAMSIQEIVTTWIPPEPEPVDETKLSETDLASIAGDLKFLDDLPKSYTDLPKEDLKNVLVQIDNKIAKLTAERDSLLAQAVRNEELIKAKENTIGSLGKEKNIIGLTLAGGDLRDANGNLIGENGDLKIQQDKLKKYLYISLSVLVLLGLVIAVVLQRKRIQVQDVEIGDQLNEINKKNSYLEHAARIIRHDMHSGINTYMPRGLSSLERRLSSEDITSLKIESPIRMIKEGLKHSQKVYKGVYEFTNLVKTDVVLTKTECSIQKIMDDYLTSTAYKSQVHLDDNLPTIEVNESLMCTSIDNLIRNGLKYNDSKSKVVKIYSEDGYICIEDNGRGIDQKDFDELSKPYVRKEGQKETGTGLGLNICKAILKEHGFDITAEKLEQGTKLRIKIK
jgi:signal transduction histidine kinase